MESSGNRLAIPISIVVAGALIAGAVYFTNKSTEQTATGPDTDTAAQDINIRETSANDHILGNPEAPIVIVEYSDFRCPFCKIHHETLHRIIDEYGVSGEVAWVYRHAPLTQIGGHEDAAVLALASECAAAQGGNNAFWKFADALFGAMPDPRVTGATPFDAQTGLPQVAAAANVDYATLTTCMNAGTYQERVETDLREAVDASPNGQIGTPYNILVVNGEYIPVQGAQPYESFRAVIESIRQELSGTPGAQAVPVE